MWPNLSLSQKRHPPGLSEVRIGRHSLAQAALGHDHKARAVHKRIGVVEMLSQILLAPHKQRVIHPGL